MHKFIHITELKDQKYKSLVESVLVNRHYIFYLLYHELNHFVMLYPLSWRFLELTIGKQNGHDDDLASSIFWRMIKGFQGQ